MIGDLRASLRAWLEFAREMGIEALPAPPMAVAAIPGAASVVAPSRPAQVAQPAAPPAGNPIEKLRQSLAMAGKRRPAPPAAFPPAAAEAVAAPSEAPEPKRAPLSRVLAVPPEMLVIPPDPGAPAAGADPGPGKTLDEVRAVLGDCRRCKLSQGRNKIVFGSGNPEAELMFVGEGPGRDEDLQGLPFVGRAGALLTDIIKAIGMSRDQVYIANVVKCRPPENRTPEPGEIEACRGFLFRQIAVIRPRLVVALGKPATETLLGRPVALSEVRGREFDLCGARLVPTFHPAYLLRNPAKKREVWEDMKMVRDLLRG